MKKKPVAPVPIEEPPVYACGNCWFFETRDQDSGTCYAVPPQIMFTSEAEPIQTARPVVNTDDKGCVHWKTRHPIC